MNDITLHVQLTGLARTTANLESITTAADAAVWRSAAAVLRERTYVTAGGVVRVRVDWDPLVMRDPGEEAAVQFEVQVADERRKPDARDAASFVALFFHDAFLLLNLAVPGSFGGAIDILSGDEHRASAIALNARMFEYAWATAARNGSSPIEPLPLPDVIAWYDALHLGTSQVATKDVAKALFLILQLARREEDESTSVIRLAQALEAVLDAGEQDDDELAQLFELRDAIVHGAAPVLHPLADDSLDELVDEESLALVNASDFAGSVLVSALQARIRAVSR
jgi:hypothetical protein